MPYVMWRGKRTWGTITGSAGAVFKGKPTLFYRLADPQGKRMGSYWRVGSGRKGKYTLMPSGWELPAIYGAMTATETKKLEKKMTGRKKRSSKAKTKTVSFKLAGCGPTQTRKLKWNAKRKRYLFA